MTEEELSEQLFMAASDDDALVVISWQAVNGKGYFTADVKLRLPTGERLEPDLIVSAPGTIWLLEVKARHSDALLDERKLARLFGSASSEQLLAQISRRAGLEPIRGEIKGVVAYAVDDLGSTERCNASIGHLFWEAIEADTRRRGLRNVLADRL